jgi:nucleoside-diphosphate-sugar epimerase
MDLDHPLRIAVLGGGGFIGCNLVRRLARLGHQVWAIDVEFPPWRHAWLDQPNVECRTIDLRSVAGAHAAVVGMDVVFHLAADMGGVGYFHSDADLGAALTNGLITNNVIDACTTAGVERLVYTSSACAYPIEWQVYDAVRPGPHDRSGAVTVPMLAEEDVGQGTPDALYGAEKLHGLRLCSKVTGARVCVLHTVYGPGQEHEGRRMKFPAAVATKAIAAKTSGTLELWGDGGQIRSYLHVDDAVEMILAVAFAAAYNGPVNIGSSIPHSCRSVAEIALGIVGADLAAITTNPDEPTGVYARNADITKYETLYGPAPDMGIVTGMTDFIRWLQTLPAVS